MMNYQDIPLIIPVLAAVYLFAVYLLLALAQRSVKWSRSRSSVR